MDSTSATLPDLERLDVAELKVLLYEQHAQLVAKDAQLLSHTLLIERLKLEILRLRRLQYGRRSEKREQQIEQLELWVEELEAADAQRAVALVEPTGRAMRSSSSIFLATHFGHDLRGGKVGCMAHPICRQPARKH